MGIGRREFLKFAALAIGEVALQPLEDVFIDGEYYVNTRLGLGFIKPVQWQFDAFVDFAPKVEGQIVQGVSFESEEAFRRELTSSLLAAMSKYDDSEIKFGPSIVVFKNTDDWLALKDQALNRTVSDSISGFASLLKNFAVFEQPPACTVSNCRAIRYKARWLFEHRKIPAVPTETETLIIAQEDALYTIHLHDSPVTGEIARNEFRTFLNSLHIA